MAKDPAFLFYSQDFLVGTITMSMEDKGRYITLLCLMHQSGRLDEKTIVQVVGEFTAPLRDKFKQDENGFFYNERLEYETKKRNEYTESRRNNAKRTKNNTHIKESDISNEHMLEHMVEHMENINIDISITKEDSISLLESKKNKLREELSKYLDTYGREMLNDFYSYWTELSKNGKKLRLDGEKYFDVARRLATWKSRSNGKYGGKNEVPNLSKKIYTNAKDLKYGEQEAPIV